MSDSIRVFLSTVGKYAGRIVFLAALAWFGLVVAESVTTRGQPTSAPAAETPAGHTLDAFIPDAGTWSFTGSPLTMQRTQHTTAELNHTLAAIRNRQADPTAPQQDASDLVALAEANQAELLRTETTNLWTLDATQLRLRIVTTQDEPPLLIAAIIATANGSNWDTMQLVLGTIEINNHLLPMGDASNTICSRRTENGTVGMQLIQTSQPAAKLLQLWAHAGWRMRHTDWGTPASFSYLCVRGDEVIYAWSAAAEGLRTLMLTRTTTSETTTGSVR